MAWKSREDKAPPPQFFADVIGYLHHAFPGAALSREVLEALAPHLVREWRNGQSARNAAKATCACDGRTITISPAAQVTLGRRAVLPPAQATRGTLFGIDALRERREVGKLRVQAAVELRHAEYEAGKITRLQADQQRWVDAGKAGKAAKVADAIAAAERAMQAHRSRAAQLLQQADELARARGFWIPPAAQNQIAAQPIRRPASRMQKQAADKAAIESGEPQVKKGQPGAKKRKCDLCAQDPAEDAELSALVDAFVDAASQDEGA